MKFTELESRMVNARGGGRGNGQLLFTGHGASVCEDVKVLKMDGWDGCTTK